MTRPVGRPLGPIHHAMLDAWRTHGPSTVREAAARAQVGFQAAARTAHRMLRDGHVIAVRKGRPAILALPERATRTDAVDVSSTWNRPTNTNENPQSTG